MRYCIFIFLLLSANSSNAQEAKVFKVETDSVSFKSADGKIVFGGTLSKPVDKKSFPTVVMVSGTGKQDRDGTMAGHKIFAQIATHLAKHGIAMLRTDDRGVGRTSGVYEMATTGDFAKDALAAVTYLKSREDIDPVKIGLIGHSEGGAAISIAAAESMDVKFLVSVAGLAMSGLDAQLKQNEDIIAASSLPDYDKKRSNEINAIMFKTAFRYADSDSLEVRLNDAYQQWKVKDDAYFKTLNIQFDHFRFPIYSYIQNSKGPWYRYFIQYDAEKTIRCIKVPILAISGAQDLMVAPDENLANWKNFALEGGNKKVTTVKIPGLNHLLLPCKICDNGEVSKIQDGFSTQALTLIKDWICNTVE